MVEQLSDTAKQRDELKTQLTFLFDSIPEYIVIAAVRETMDHYGWVLMTNSKLRALNKTKNHHTVLCEQLVGTLSGINVEMRSIQESVAKRIETLDRLVKIALDTVNNPDPEQAP